MGSFLEKNIHAHTSGGVLDRSVRPSVVVSASALPTASFQVELSESAGFDAASLFDAAYLSVFASQPTQARAFSFIRRAVFQDLSPFHNQCRPRAATGSPSRRHPARVPAARPRLTCRAPDPVPTSERWCTVRVVGEGQVLRTVLIRRHLSGCAGVHIAEGARQHAALRADGDRIVTRRIVRQIKVGRAPHRAAVEEVGGPGNYVRACCCKSARSWKRTA